MALVAFAAVAVAGFPQQPAQPVIGIITHPVDQCGPPPPGPTTYDQCVESFYARWLEAAGVRVVAIPYNATADTQKWFLDRVNGVLFQGGGLGGQRLADYVVMVERVLNYALDRNGQGDHFVVWGTCQGFQVLAAAAARNVSVIQGPYAGMYPLMMPVNFTLAQPSSRMLGDAACPSNVREAMLTKNSTLNWHHSIIEPASFTKYPSLGSTFTPLTSNIVAEGTQEFISAYEAPAAEVYAVQFHPERPPYEFSNDGIGHTADDIAISEYLARFIASRLKLNNHSFDSPAQAEANRLARWPLVDRGWGVRSYYVSVGDPVQ